MKLYVWENALVDYTPGIMFAIAESAEQARAELLRDCSYIPEHELERAPKEYSLDKPVAYSVWGGG